MQQLGQYVVSLTCAAMISGILLCLIPEGTARCILRMVCGVFLAATALSPLSKVPLPDFSGMERYLAEGESYSAMGQQLAQEDRNARIKSEMESYILDKAAAAGFTISAEVFVNAAGETVSVRLSGKLEERSRESLEQILSHDPGIPKEDLHWTG